MSAHRKEQYHVSYTSCTLLLQGTYAFKLFLSMVWIRGVGGHGDYLEKEAPTLGELMGMQPVKLDFMSAALHAPIRLP